MVDTQSGSVRRVKLYMLNEDRAWEDRGTGHVSAVYLDKHKGICLLVRSEEDGSILLESKIQGHTAYNKQQCTLIVWSEMDNDHALSFQEQAGCDEIWEKICQVQGKDPSIEITQNVDSGHGDGAGDEMAVDEERFDDVGEAPHLETPPIELPRCDLSRLEEISTIFNSTLLIPVRRDSLAMVIENDGYINQLLELFRVSEDLENMDGLHHLYEIFKSIFLLNKTALFEIMFADETIFDVVGVLEYDPALPIPAKHREYLKGKSKFKEVIPLNNPELVQKIHQTYRVQYIQDVILPTPSVFEENMLSTLSSFIFFKKGEIVSMIQEDEKLLQSLFSQIVDDETDDAKRKDMVLFLKELFNFSQTLQNTSKDAFFKLLANLGILGALEIILGFDDQEMKAAAIDIFSYILEYNSSMVREFILQEAHHQDDEDLLINLVIEQMINDTDPELGGALQLMGIIRLLIDPENMLVGAGTNSTEKSDFLMFFYKHSMHVLTAPLFANTADDKPCRDDYHTAQLLSLILELFTFCIEHHSYHVKNYVLQKDLIRRVLVLLKSKHTFLALSALRLVRKVIGLKDEFYNRYIIKGDLFKPIVNAFVANGSKYNLLNSALVEIFEFIREESSSLKSLLIYVIEQHYKSFENVTYVNTFKNMKCKYEQLQDEAASDKPSIDRWGSSDSAPSILRNNRFRRDARTLEEEEEMWFDQDDDFDDAGDALIPIGDVGKTKMGAEFDQLMNKYIERNRFGAKENELEKPVAGRVFNRSSNAINIHLNRSPPGSNNPTPTPASSPVSSPVTSPNNKTINQEKSNSPANSNGNQKKSPGLIGLVDYDEDSEEDEESDEDANLPASKRPRLTVHCINNS